MPSSPLPRLLALDFDGVICDGLLEYFQTAWKAYCEVFQPATPEPPLGLAERFYPLRPVVETGWEMPLVLYGLLSGVADEAIRDDWPSLIPQLIAEGRVEPAQLGAAVDGVRDRWMAADLEGWLGLHRFYPGVLPRLHQAQAQGTDLIIISTKEGRFIQRLLAQQGLALTADRILGKEVKQPKYTTLGQLQAAHPDAPIWFVEDRIKALQAVQDQPDLDTIQLFLADWGYNTAADQALAAANRRMHRLTLAQFAQPFAGWIP
ncbi:haloacid dehalogenase [Leptolyngbya sp. BL0902]|uniref:HAD family hydrolase n=1 Tax=Leptolyngbya sp. BL0902 TaxID=1115757 RepID=UPI0018E6FAFB|nr:HAD family hydrolase [Leptolyngbya sp. BL0902]QQE64776.1 haloacid dehalogenase [Leptolyngbya sp. BL0902]